MQRLLQVRLYADCLIFILIFANLADEDESTETTVDLAAIVKSIGQIKVEVHRASRAKASLAFLSEIPNHHNVHGLSEKMLKGSSKTHGTK